MGVSDQSLDNAWSVETGIFATLAGKKVIRALRENRPTSIAIDDLKQLTKDHAWPVSHYELLEQIRRVRCHRDDVHSIYAAMDSIRDAIEQCKTIQRTRRSSSSRMPLPSRSRSVVSEAPSVTSQFTSTSLLRKSVVPVDSTYSLHRT